MREVMLGVVMVGIVGGVVLGRNTERARRAVREWGTARSTVPKAKTAMLGEVRRAVITALIIVAVAVAVVSVMLREPSGS